MTYLVKIIGSALLLYAALFLTREYEGSLGKGLRVCRGFCELIAHIRRRIDGYLTPANDLLNGFECGALDETGYISKARERGLCAAYFELEAELPLDGRVRGALSGFFSDFGKDYKEETVKAADAVLEALREHIGAIVKENERSVRLARTLAVAAVLGIIILLI